MTATPEQNTAQDWLAAISKTVKLRNIHAHMGLVSKSVRVYGIPGVNTITYIDWRKRRQTEFEQDLLEELSYDFIRIKKITTKRIHFLAIETMTARSGNSFEIYKDIIIEKEYDGIWRVVEEKITAIETK
ncbi:hypothetical protein MNBD_GAMMA22-2303 [hydrothermal vent metagenome]|uniref:PH domain-containing protein n=1 Tax=hydrothermal vent metagenome TaxID=652676 RepID=A0A3B1AH19_9ZZZZ